MDDNGGDARWRISRLRVKRFKSLVDFDLVMPKFCCLVGLNGSGKSTVLQFIDFLSHLVCGDIEDWLELRGWKPSDVRSKQHSRLNVNFTVDFSDNQGDLAATWSATFSPAVARCTSEDFASQHHEFIVTRREMQFLGWNQPSQKVQFEYHGSIISLLNEELLPPVVLAVKRTLLGIESLETLSPERLRRRTLAANGTLGHGGMNLAEFLHELKRSGQNELRAVLEKAYPNLAAIRTKSLRSGWKELAITERVEGNDGAITTVATHVNDGMLRMLAMFAAMASDHGILLFDEIENGINTELFEFVMDAMVQNPRQIIVTTHSPVILNYLEDDVARESVIYLYRTAAGATKAVPFFSIPSQRQKLEVMGPGEAFMDTKLTELGDEIAAMPVAVA